VLDRGYTASGRGLGAGRTASAKRARTSASILSVLASLPVALAKSLAWRGLTTATGKPSAAKAASTARSKPPVASRITSSVRSSTRRETKVFDFFAVFSILVDQGRSRYVVPFWPILRPQTRYKGRGVMVPRPAKDLSFGLGELDYGLLGSIGHLGVGAGSTVQRVVTVYTVF
jgi:hypothetical protein